MFRRPLTIGLGLLALLLAPHMWADSEYWVAVGSYRDLPDAETAQRQASGLLPETFSVIQAQTDSGLWYRVLAGPYLTREIADHMVGEAVRSGFDNAWILSMEMGSVGGSLAASGDYGMGLDDYESDRSSLDTGGYDFEPPEYKVPSSEPADIPGFNAPIRPDSDKEHRLIDEAPEGYNLHQLIRDQANLDWKSPYLMATIGVRMLTAELEANSV